MESDTHYMFAHPLYTMVMLVLATEYVLAQRQNCNREPADAGSTRAGQAV